MLTSIVSSWLIFFALRQILSSFVQGRQFLAQLTSTGIRFSLFHISYETSIFNNFFFSYFNSQNPWKRRLYTKWFDIGAICMAIGQIASLVLLSVSLAYSLCELLAESDAVSYSYTQSASSKSGVDVSNRYDSFTSSTSQPSSPDESSHFSSHSSSHSQHATYTPTIAPIIPGVNFPIEYVCEFWFVTFCVIVVHEFGHAAAASLERLQIQGCGTFFLLLFPGAYVKIEESVMYLPVPAQLRIYSAGILHNIIMAVLSFLLLFQLPFFLACMGFTSPVDSLVVSSLDPSSVLRGHLHVGDHLGYINDQPVNSMAGLSALLAAEHTKKPYLTSVSFGADDLSMDSHIKQQYHPLWQHAFNSTKSPEYRKKVLYGSGVCVPPSLLHSPVSSSHHFQNIYHSGTTTNSMDQLATSLGCCQQVLLKNAPTTIGGTYQSCFVTSHDGSHNISDVSLHDGSGGGGKRNTLIPQLHCLTAKEVLVPRPSLSSLSHGLATPGRQRCSINSDCLHSVHETEQGKHSAGGATGVGHSNDSNNLSTKESAEEGSMSPRLSSAPLQCIHPLTAAPTHLFSLRLLPPPGGPSSLSEAGKTVLFEGTLPELMTNFEVGEVDLYPWMKPFLYNHQWIYSTLLQVPKKIALCLWLSIQLNLSVAFMNMLPVFSLDGGLACPQFARILFPRKWSLPAKVMQYFGSFLLFANGFLVLVHYTKTFYYE